MPPTTTAEPAATASSADVLSSLTDRLAATTSPHEAAAILANLDADGGVLEGVQQLLAVASQWTRRHAPDSGLWQQLSLASDDLRDIRSEVEDAAAVLQGLARREDTARRNAAQSASATVHRSALPAAWKAQPEPEPSRADAEPSQRRSR